MAIEPRTTVTMSGDIRNFAQIDNLYIAVKREGIKALKEWELNIQVDFSEKEGESTL